MCADRFAYLTPSRRRPCEKALAKAGPRPWDDLGLARDQRRRSPRFAVHEPNRMHRRERGKSLNRQRELADRPGPTRYGFLTGARMAVSGLVARDACGGGDGVRRRDALRGRRPGLNALIVSANARPTKGRPRACPQRHGQPARWRRPGRRSLASRHRRGSTEQGDPICRAAISRSSGSFQDAARGFRRGAEGGRRSATGGDRAQRVEGGHLDPLVRQRRPGRKGDILRLFLVACASPGPDRRNWTRAWPEWVLGGGHLAARGP
jgi:hypothetical protein